MDRAASKKIDLKDLTAYKSFIQLLLASVISRFGDSIDSIAYSLMIYELTGSTLLLGTIFAVNAIPGIVLSPFSGVLVDRFSKRKAAVFGDIGRALVVSLTAYLYLIGKLEPWHLFIFTFTNSTFEIFAKPAKTSLLPLVLPKELFLSANSFTTSTTSFAEILGLGAAGLIIGVLGYSGAIFIDGLTFLLSAVLIYFLKVEEPEVHKEPLNMNNYFSELKEGFIFVKSQNIVMISLVLFAFINFCLSPINVLLPAYVKDVLSLGPDGYGIIAMGFPIGMILGGLAVAQFGSRFRNSTLVSVGLGGVGLSYALFSLPGLLIIEYPLSIIIATVLFFIIGFFFPAVSAPLSSHMLSNTPKEILGRVISLAGMMTLSAMPIGGALTGLVSETFSLTSIFAVMGIFIVIVSVLPLINKDFRNA